MNLQCPARRFVAPGVSSPRRISMTCAVKVPSLHSIFFLTEPPEDREDFEIEEGAWIEVPMNHLLSTEDSPPHDPVLCRSREDHQHYKIFKYRDQVDETIWEDTSLDFGGTFSKASWARFAALFPRIRALQAITDDKGD
jgi:hypothetical protein